MTVSEDYGTKMSICVTPNSIIDLRSYTDADWAGEKNGRKSSK